MQGRQEQATEKKDKTKREKLRPEEGVEARRMSRSMARGNASATMMMINALTGSEGDLLTYCEAMESPKKREQNAHGLGRRPADVPVSYGKPRRRKLTARHTRRT